jgi:biopolymer transport protein TolR
MRKVTSDLGSALEHPEEQSELAGVYTSKTIGGFMRRINRAWKTRKLPKSEINITPLIDVLLVLIVIFMVITPVNSTGLHTAVPQASTDAKSREPEEAIILSVDRSGDIKINRESVAMAELRVRLEDIFKQRSDRTAFIQADSNLDYNDVVQVIDVAKGAGVDRIGLLTHEIVN